MIKDIFFCRGTTTSIARILPAPVSGFFFLMTSELYKLLGFIFLFKTCRNNSLRYFGESIPTFIQKTGMKISILTFKKYWKMCERYGLIETIGKHQGIIDWAECLKKLNFYFFKRRINKIINQEDLKKMTFSQTVIWVEGCILLLNFKDQQYRIKQKEPLRDFLKRIVNDNLKWQDNKKLRKLIKKAKQNGMSIKDYAQSVLASFKENVVTGSYHLSKKLGLSQRKCNNLLNYLVNKGKILKFTIKKLWFEEVNFATFDLAKSLSGGIIFPTRIGLVQILGSTILPLV